MPKKSTKKNNNINFFQDKRNITISILAVSFLILIFAGMLLGSIYLKDEPKFIPKSVKGKIRKGIENGVGQNVKKVSSSVGQAIINASFDNQTTGTGGSSVDSTENWQSYKADNLGLTVKIPQDWVIWTSDDVSLSFSDKNDSDSLKELKSQYQNTDTPYWGAKSIGLVRVDQSENVSTAQEYISKVYDGTGISVSKTVTNGLSSYYVVDNSPDRFGGGTGYYYVFDKGNKVFELSLDYFSNQNPQQDNLKILENIANSIN